MPNYKNANGLVYTEQELMSLADSAGLSQEEYLEKNKNSWEISGKPSEKIVKKKLTDKKSPPKNNFEKYKGRHITSENLKDYKWWRGEGDVIDNLKKIYGEDFKFTDVAAEGGALGFDRIVMENKKNGKKEIITLPTGLSKVMQVGFGEDTLDPLDTWDETLNTIQNFVETSDTQDDIDADGFVVNSSRNKEDFYNKTGINFEQTYGKEGGFDVIEKSEGQPSYGGYEAETHIEQGKGTPWYQFGIGKTDDEPWARTNIFSNTGISKKNPHKKLNFKETQELTSTILQHIQRAINNPEAYDLDLRDVDQDSYGRIVSDEGARRVKWTVYEEINRRMPYMIGRQQFDKLVGDFTNNKLLRYAIEKKRTGIDQKLLHDSNKDIKGQSYSELLNNKDPYTNNYEKKRVDNLSAPLKEKKKILDDTYKVAEAEYWKLKRERDKLPRVEASVSKYKDLTKLMEAEEEKMKNADTNILALAEEYNSFWKSGKTFNEIKASFIENGYDPYRAEQLAKAGMNYDVSEDVSEVAESNPTLNMREVYDKALGLKMGEGNNILEEMKNEFVTINNPHAPVTDKEREMVRLAKENNLIEYHSDGSMKSLKISVHDALTKIGYDGRDFDSFFNPLDKSSWFQNFGTDRRINMSEKDINLLKDMEATLDKNRIETDILWDATNLNIGVEDIKKSTWVGNAVGVAYEESGKMFFNMSPHQASRSRSNIVSVFTGGRKNDYTPRVKLDQIQQVAAIYNTFYEKDIKDGKMQSMSFTEKELDHIDKNFGEYASEVVGGFVPIMAKLGAITLATRGMGTIPAIARLSNALKAQRLIGGTWGKIQYHVAHAALLEAQMKWAGFKPTSGAAFYIGGQLGSRVKLPGLLAFANPLFQKTIMAGATGTASMEFASITELAWDNLKGERDWESHMKILYGDHDEIEKRILSHALAFGINGLHKVDYRKGKDLYPAFAKKRVIDRITEKQNKMMEEVMGEKEWKEYRKGLSSKEKVDLAMEISRLEQELFGEYEEYIVYKDGTRRKITRTTAANIKPGDLPPGAKIITRTSTGGKLPEGFEKLSKKAREKWLTWEASKRDVRDLYHHLMLNEKLDKNLPTEELEKNVREISLDPFNKMMRNLTDGKHKDIDIAFVEKPWLDLKLITGKDGIKRWKSVQSKDEARYNPNTGKIEFLKSAFNPGKIAHEFTHVMLRNLLKEYNLEDQFVARMKEVFSDYNFHVGYDVQGNVALISGKELGKAIKGQKEYREVQNEEFLAFMGEFLASPEMYNKYVAPAFLQNIKQELMATFRGSAYKPTISEPMDLIKVFANFGRAVQTGNQKQMEQAARVLEDIRNIDFFQVEGVVKSEGGINNMKRKSKKIFDREFESEKAKDTKSELQEQLKQEREKFFESKKDLDPVKDKEKIEQKRNEFLKVQEEIKSKIADQIAVISGKRDYEKEIKDFREKNTDPKARNKFIAKLNAEVSELMTEVKGIENVQKLWNERNKLNKQKNETFPDQLQKGKISKREYDNKVSDVNQRLKEIDKAVDWTTWNKLAGNLMVINAGKIENVTQRAYKLGAAYGSGRIGKSELKTALDMQFLEVVADYNFKNPKGLAEFGAYMNTSLPTKIGAAYKMEAAGAKPKWAKAVGVKEAENIVDTGTPIIESSIKTKSRKKPTQTKKEIEKTKETDPVLELENTGTEALVEMKVDAVAKKEINKKIKSEGIVNSEVMYEKALRQYKKEKLPTGERRYTDKQAEELAKTTTWDNVNSGVIQEFAPEVANTILGITPKKGNLSQGSVKNTQDWMDVNAGEFLKIMKWNSAIVPGEGIPARMIGVSMNLPKKWLDKFYHEATNQELIDMGFKISEKTGRVETPAGPRPKILNEGITVEQVKEFVGVMPDGTRVIDRNTSSTVKGVSTILDKAISNQLIRKAIENGSVELSTEYKAKEVVNRIANGKPVELASQRMFEGLAQMWKIKPSEAEINLMAWVNGERSGIPKERLNFMDKIQSGESGFRNRILDMLEARVDYNKTNNVIKSAKETVKYHQENTVVKPEYINGNRNMAEKLGITIEKYSELQRNAAEKTTSGVVGKEKGQKVIEVETVKLQNKYVGEYVKLLPKGINLTTARALAGESLGGRTGRQTFVEGFSNKFKIKDKALIQYKKEKLPTGKRRYTDKQAEELASKEASKIVKKWENGEKVNETYKKYLDNKKGGTGLFIKNKKGNLIELDYRVKGKPNPLLTDFNKNVKENLGKNTHPIFKDVNVKELKTGSQLAKAYEKARRLAEEGKMEAAEAELAKAFTALDAKTKKAMYEGTGFAMEQFILNAKKGNIKDISNRLEYVFRIAKNNTSLTEGERVFTNNRFVRIVSGEGTGANSPMIKDLMSTGLSLKQAVNKTKGKVEHSKTSLNASYQKAYSVTSGMWSAEASRIAKDYIGIFASTGRLDFIDLQGTRTNAAKLARMAKAREDLVNYKEWDAVKEKFTGKTLEDILLEEVVIDLQALGVKINMKTAKENYLRDAVNNFIMKPSAASAVGVGKAIKNKNAIEAQTKTNLNIAKNARIPIRNNATNSEILSSMKIFDKARELGRITKKERRGISVWDFDDTIARTKSGVLAKIPNPSGTPMPKRKVIFMAGGPGAGKSSVIKGLGLEKQGFKIVNQDISLQWLAKNHGLPKDMRDFTSEQRSKWSSLQWEAREIAQKKQIKFEGRGDGIIVDGTGQSAGSMTAQMNAFRRKGYDVSMLYVETSLPTALARNRARKERSLTDKIVERTWKNVDFNKKGFKEEFGENFIEVKTDKLKFGDPLPPEVVAKADKFTKSYEKRRLTAEEFANRGKQLLDNGAKFDFSEFELVREGQPGPFFDKFVKRMKKYGPQDNFILTARPPSSAPHIQMWLKMEGYEIPLKNITGLGNSTAEAKAMWILEKASRGYNDFYFADDAIKNVKEVKNALDQLDVKSKVQQAKLASKKLFNNQFNEILEQTSGVPAKAVISDVKATMMGKGKRTKSLLLPQQQDFMGLMQNFMGKGKKGEAHQKWFEDNLNAPYARGFNELMAHRESIMHDFKHLKDAFPEINGNLKTKGNKYRHGFKDLINRKWPSTWKEIPNLKNPNRKGNYTYEDAIRVYLWNKNNIEIPGLSKADNNKLIETITKDPILLNYAEKLGELSRQENGYVEPSKYWFNETLMSDVYKMTQELGQKKFLAEWIENKNAIFTPENMNKIEATQGKWFRESLEDMLYAMEMGTNRPSGMSREAAMFMNYINGSVGATMNWNMRSAIIQQLSMINFINWKDNNPIQAAKAFANIPQFAKDYAMIFNSPMMRQRRKGLKINVSESEIASAVQTGGARGLFNYFLKLGFTPTMLGDSNAIAFGGATFYRNRLKTYLKQGMEQKAAEKQAFLDFQRRSEPTQQSSRPDLVSKWQRDPWLGRFLMAFASVNSQQVRRGEKATRNAINKRGDQRENLSQMATYGFLQPILYGAMSAALIGLYLDEDDLFTEKEQKDKVWRFANTALDSQLRGLGYPGAGVSALKNTAFEWHKQNKKPWGADHAYTIMQLTSMSPTLNIKLRDIYGGLKTFDYNENAISEMDTWDLDNPMWMGVSQIVQGTTNLPTKRFMYKRQNLKGGLDQNALWWQRGHMISGWSPWDVGYETETQKIRQDLKKKKKKKQSIYVP